MSTFKEYADKYENIAMTRDENGILEVRFHTDGETLRWGPAMHTETWKAFRDIGEDPENRLMILTGTGDAFCREFAIDFSGDSNPKVWDVTIADGRRFIDYLINIPVPVIGALNGPVHVHPEMFALCDILIAADDSSFQDFHMLPPDVPGGVVPGDGNHFIWPAVLGENRGKYFLLTGQILGAQEAYQAGLINEMLPREKVLPRARELATQLVTNKSRLTLNYTRQLFTQRFRKQTTEELWQGVALEGLAVIDDLNK